MDPDLPLIRIDELSQGIMVVALYAEHDLSTVPQLKQALLAGQSIAVDLSEASFIDSSVVGALIAASSERLLVVVSPPDTQPRRVLDTVVAGDLMSLVDNRAAALETFGVDQPPELAG